MDYFETNAEFISMKAELLNLYLEKVRYVYALAFFQWRKSTTSTAEQTDDIKLIFDERRETILT